MPIQEMANGTSVNIPDDITPEGLAKVLAANGGPAQGSTLVKAGSSGQSAAVAPALTVRQQQDLASIARTKAQLNKVDQTNIFGADAGRLQSAIVHGATLNLDDLTGPALQAITEGTANAIKTGDIGEIGRSFSNAREATRQYRADLAANHP